MREKGLHHATSSSANHTQKHKNDLRIISRVGVDTVGTFRTIRVGVRSRAITVAIIIYDTISHHLR
jgi:hypothetical protein